MKRNIPASTRGTPKNAGAAKTQSSQGPERLQKVLAAAGVASRRKAEEMILQGRIQVNGQIVTQLGSKADPIHDHIRVDGKLIHRIPGHRYYMLNKPKQFVTTASDPQGRPTVMQFFSHANPRMFPVGRLDYHTEGLLLVTNDGVLANSLTRAASHVPKTYLVKVSGVPSENALNKLRHGVSIPLDDLKAAPAPRGRSRRVMTAPARIRLFREGENPWYEITITEGRNRQLRKMFEEVGHHIEKIRRVQFGPLELDVPPGESRELTSREVQSLYRAVQNSSSSSRTPQSDADGAEPTGSDHKPARSLKSSGPFFRKTEAKHKPRKKTSRTGN